jgi:hypothetical protein
MSLFFIINGLRRRVAALVCLERENVVFKVVGDAKDETIKQMSIRYENKLKVNNYPTKE